MATEPKPRKPRAKKPPKPPLQSDAIQTRDIARLLQYYEMNIRNDGKILGIFRQVQRLVAKGITLSQISQAMQKYAADPWVKGQDERRRMPVRGFMTVNYIRKWQTDIPDYFADPALRVLSALTAAGHERLPVPVAPLVVEDDDSPLEI